MDERFPGPDSIVRRTLSSGIMILAYENPASLMNTILGVFGMMERIGLNVREQKGLDYLQRFPDLIRSISADQVQAAARKYLSDEQLVIALAGSLPAA